MDFLTFQASQPAQSIFKKLGLLSFLKSATSWHVLRWLIVDFNGCDKGRFVDLVRKCDGVCSSGERVLLHTILHATDFDWLADELGEGRVWRNMDRADGDYLAAVAACIEKREAA